MFYFALLSFSISLLVWLFLIIIIQIENKRKRRFGLSYFRDWLDGVVFELEDQIVKSWNHFVKYILQLHWYYGIHSLLRALLQMMIAVYSYFEDLFENNRSRAKKLRAEKKRLKKSGHLYEMAEHKKDTALTPTQQQNLKNKKLEEH